ncbi:MAG: hypothetical protein ACM3NH_01535 [Candidatus Saccharibacteria bacterium]
MLSQLLSSKPKSNLVNLFLAHPDRSFSFTELRVTGRCSGPLLKKTLKELSKMGFLIEYVKDRSRYYQVDRHFALYPELVNLLRKIRRMPEDLLAKAAGKVGDSRFTALTGVFVGKPRIECDILFVGKISQRRLEKFLKLAEKFAEREVVYTILTADEFDYRKIMNDRFLKNILENNPVIVVDRIRGRSERRLSKVMIKV